MAEHRLGNRIKDARTALDMTQTELAARIRVSRKTINTIENGIFTPSTILALLISSALGKTVEQLFFLDD
jgi:putative transcriptional regulator